MTFLRKTCTEMQRASSRAQSRSSTERASSTSHVCPNVMQPILLCSALPVRARYSMSFCMSVHLTFITNPFMQEPILLAIEGGMPSDARIEAVRAFREARASNEGGAPIFCVSVIEPTGSLWSSSTLSPQVCAFLAPVGQRGPSS